MAKLHRAIHELGDILLQPIQLLFCGLPVTIKAWSLESWLLSQLLYFRRVDCYGDDIELFDWEVLLEMLNGYWLGRQGQPLPALLVVLQIVVVESFKGGTFRIVWMKLHRGLYILATVFLQQNSFAGDWDSPLSPRCHNFVNLKVMFEAVELASVN